MRCDQDISPCRAHKQRPAVNQAVCIALLVVMNVIWAGSNSVVKYTLDSIDSLALVFWRFLFALIILAGIIFVRKIPLKIERRDLLRIIGAGLTLGISNTLWVSGIKFSQAIDTSLLYVFEPIWGIILAGIFLREKLRLTALGGLVIVIIGLLRLSDFDFASFGFQSGSLGLGNLLVVLALLSEGFYSIILKPVATRSSAVVVNAGVLLVTVSILAVPMAVRGNFALPAKVEPLLALAYLSILCTVVGYTLWVAIMKHMPVGIMLFTIFVQPITGPLIANLTLGEPLDERVLTGAILLIAGMATAVGGHFLQTRRERKKMVSAEIAIAPYANA